MSDTIAGDIEKRIRQVLVSALEIKPETLTGSGPDMPLLGRGIGLDSMEALALVVGLEREFDMAIDDEDLTVDLFKTIGTLAEYLRQKIRES